MILGIAIPRTTALDATWTTVHVARAALARGHRVRFVESWDFEVDDRSQMVARAYTFEPGEVSAATLVDALQTRSAPRRYLRIDSLDVLLLRANPFDPTLLAFAEMAKARGVDVVNDPAALLRLVSKAWLAGLADVPTPPTLVTQSLAMAEVFYEKHRKPVVLKPARGSGGQGVTLVRRRDRAGFETAFDRARAGGEHVVVQTYLEEAEHGEKRLVWMDGFVLGGYLRKRADGEFRHNLKQGGEAVSTTITPSELAVIARLTPHLLATGIRLVGIDMIGQSIIEVNALNPGGAYHADRLHGTDVAGMIVDLLARSVAPLHAGRDAWARSAP